MVLGSCIAVVLYDTEKGICGMNHFMIPDKRPNSETFYLSQTGK